MLKIDLYSLLPSCFRRFFFPWLLLAAGGAWIVASAQVMVAPSTQVSIAPIPQEVSSNHFTVTVSGTQSPITSPITSSVMHAASGYYLLNFDLAGPAQVTVTASDPHYWDAGVEVQPMRLGIRPHREGASISFPLAGPAKLSITRPGDHFGDSEMLFLFANEPDRSGITAQTKGVRYYGSGVHRENIDAHSGDTIYLAPGALILGALNIWQVHDVHISGRGTILYDGPQNPNDDVGWMHKPNWHVIVMDNAHNITIEGITAIVRSRTWMVQMRDSRGITFRNVKIIGGSPGNANQDGMDWLGGGDTLVQDSFIRAADDIFAMYGNWDGYTEEALTTPGHEVSNITIENSVLSTSISNVVRAGWPKKIFDSHNFSMTNSDVIHMGMGGCGVPFALFEIWADPAGKGHHTGYHFENIRLEDWYSLVQLRQPNPAIRDISFKDIWAMDGPGMVSSALKGDVAGVTLSGLNLGTGPVGKNSDVPLDVLAGAEEPHYEGAWLLGGSKYMGGFTYTQGFLRAGSDVVFTAEPMAGMHYRWYFGDGATGEGQSAHHAFADAEGTLLDHTGRYRVLLLVTNDAGHQAWSSRSITLSRSVEPPPVALPDAALSPGLAKLQGAGHSYKGFIRIPADGGYTLTLLTSTSASLTLDGISVESRKLRPQVCGSPGAAVEPIRVSAALTRGLHRIQVLRGPEIENAATSSVAGDRPVLFWEGPGVSQQLLPDAMLFHDSR